MMKIFHKISLLFLITFFACNWTDKKIEVNQDKFPNVIKSQQFGDTLRLEIEKRGDMLIKHFIDLKGTKDDNFDGSYNVICTYAKFVNDTTIKSNFFLTINDYLLYFDSKRIATYCDSMLNTVDSDNGENDSINYYKNLKKRALLQTSDYFINQDAELILNFNFHIVNQKSQDIPKTILVEFYETEFSKGENFFVIKSNGDTTELFNNKILMK